MHSGMTGLVNVAYNESNSTVIIVDNSITGMTGHQQNPTTGFNLKGDPCTKIDLETLCRAVGIRRVRVVDPYDLDQCDRALKEELAADEPSVRTFYYHQPPSLCPAEICQAQKARHHRPRQVHELQNVHEDRLPRHQHDRRQGRR